MNSGWNLKKGFGLTGKNGEGYVYVYIQTKEGKAYGEYELFEKLALMGIFIWFFFHL